MRKQNSILKKKFRRYQENGCIDCREVFVLMFQNTRTHMYTQYICIYTQIIYVHTSISSMSVCIYLRIHVCVCIYI